MSFHSSSTPFLLRRPSSVSLESWPSTDNINGVTVHIQDDANVQNARMDGVHVGDARMYGTHIDVANFEDHQLEGAHIEDAHINVAAHMFTDEQLNALLSRIPVNNPSVSVNAPTASNNSCSTFTAPPFPFDYADKPSMHMASIESIPDHFPSVPPATLHEIIHFNFSPLDLYKLDPTACLEANSSPIQHFPTLASLMEPLFVYFQILGCYAASSHSASAVLAVNRASLAYCNHLSSLNRTHQWSAILQYHTQFFYRRSREMTHGRFSGWVSPDNELMGQLLFDRRLPRNRLYSSYLYFLLIIFVALQAGRILLIV